MLFLVLMPLASAALRLPPMAYSPRPYLVLLTIYQMTTEIQITIITGTGIGPTAPWPILTKLPS